MEQEKTIQIWAESMKFWLVAAVVSAMIALLYFDAIQLMTAVWINMEEYGHGFMLPLITLFLIWQKKDILETMEFTGSWYGFMLAIVAVTVYVLGELSGLVTLVQYSMVLFIFALVLSILGLRAFKVIFVPLCILLFMIPLPNIVFNNLSAYLQLVSSEIGVFVIRLFGISVFLEGNIIDLGTYQLQVVEACNGLRYLFPLMTLSFIAAYFFKGSFWKKAIIFLSSIPITVFMNSFRIGVIGVLVEHYGIGMAEGFLHDFEGWVVFMACIFVLVLEMWILARIGKNKLSLSEAFGIYMPNDTPEDAVVVYRKPTVQFWSSVVLLTGLLLSSTVLPEREMKVDFDRKDFSEFPREVDGWVGTDEKISQLHLDILRLDDYAMINYYKDGALVNFYSAFYKYQEKGGKGIHSPRSCIPGGGWQIKSLDVQAIEGVEIGGVPLKVNRLVIQQGEIKQLVYYWFQQRGRIVTNEYMVKWYLFLDAFNDNRTDGALIRLTTVLKSGQDIEIADDRLESFVKEIAAKIPEFVPE